MIASEDWSPISEFLSEAGVEPHAMGLAAKLDYCPDFTAVIKMLAHDNSGSKCKEALESMVCRFTTLQKLMFGSKDTPFDRAASVYTSTSYMWD